MNRVRIEKPEVAGDTLIGEVYPTGEVSRFFSGKPFKASYSTNIEVLPDHIRPIPILAHVCPVAWATGADVVVETADATFLDALRRVRSSLLEMYPEFMEGGSIYCLNPVDSDADPGSHDGSGVLFTGGVDSTATYVRHREEDPDLISIRGWVIGEDDDERWDRTLEFVSSFAEERGHKNEFVESNMLKFLAMPLLQAHFQRYLDGPWYSAVGHGVGLLGLCAPLAYTKGWGDLYIAATHTPDWPRPWGSDPKIDNEVEWSGTSASHDGYELTRVEKLERIAEYVEKDSPSLPLRTCGYGDGYANCSECEKCYRTIVCLLMAGLDPNDHGYEFDSETFNEIQQHFESDDTFLSPTTTYHWGVIQEAAHDKTIEGYPGADSFLEWLKQEDFESLVTESKRPLRHRLLQRIARLTPTPVYSSLYPVYRRVSDAPR